VRWYIKPPFDGIFIQQYLYKNYWNKTPIVEIIVGGWVVSFLRHSVYHHKHRHHHHRR